MKRREIDTKMIAQSRLETNFSRLLNQCELMVSQGSVQDVKLEKYLECLERMLLDLKQSPGKPSSDILDSGTNRVNNLKKIMSGGKVEFESNNAASDGQQNQLLNKGRCNQERNELLGIDNRGMRYRGGNAPSEDDLDALMKHHQNMQEKIAEEMVTLARSLKDTTLIAGKIVRDDTERLEKSGKLADQNFSRLKMESERLEMHTKRSCNWWVWMMLMLVCCTFMGMIMFMRLFSKS